MREQEDMKRIEKREEERRGKRSIYVSRNMEQGLVWGICGEVGSETESEEQRSWAVTHLLLPAPGGHCYVTIYLPWCSHSGKSLHWCVSYSAG